MNTFQKLIDPNLNRNLRSNLLIIALWALSVVINENYQIIEALGFSPKINMLFKIFGAFFTTFMVLWNQARSTDIDTPYKIGSRPRRRKKPTLRVDESTFQFPGLDLSTATIAYLYTPSISGNPVGLITVTDQPDYQIVTIDTPTSDPIEDITLEYESEDI